MVISCRQNWKANLTNIQIHATKSADIFTWKVLKSIRSLSTRLSAEVWYIKRNKNNLINGCIGKDNLRFLHSSWFYVSYGYTFNCFINCFYLFYCVIVCLLFQPNGFCFSAVLDYCAIYLSQSFFYYPLDYAVWIEVFVTFYLLKKNEILV